MNCPNCGATLDIKNKECDFCGTTFTDKELGIEKEEIKKPRTNYSKNSTNNPSYYRSMAKKKRIFSNLKQTICVILLFLLELAFAYLAISGRIVPLFESEIEGYVAFNIIILVTALIAGIICRIGRIRTGPVIVTIFNIIIAAWTVIFPLIKTGITGDNEPLILVVVVAEFIVVMIGMSICNIFCRGR